MNIPAKIDYKFPMAAYFNENYPEAQDCVTVDRQIGSLKSDIDKVLKTPIAGGDGIAKMKHSLAKKALLKNLNDRLLAKQNISTLGDCRNKIETVRQNESAQILADGSIKAENRILTDSKTKQYILIGVGALVAITVLVVLVRRK